MIKSFSIKYSALKATKLTQSVAICSPPPNSDSHRGGAKESTEKGPHCSSQGCGVGGKPMNSSGNPLVFPCKSLSIETEGEKENHYIDTTIVERDTKRDKASRGQPEQAAEFPA